MSELYIGGVPYEQWHRQVEKAKEQNEEEIVIPQPLVEVPQQKASVKYD